LQVRVNLVRGDTGLRLWSQTYEQPAGDVFAVQEDIAGQIADAVRIEMGGEKVGERPRFRVQTDNTEAYRLYLQARFLWHQRGADNIRSAVVFFEQALELEPEFAAAWAGLASALTTAGTYRTGIANHFSKAGDAARKAIELDDKIGEPYGTLAQLKMNIGEYASVEELIERGIALSPQNTTLRLWHATYLLQFGRSLDASKQIEIALRRDPAYPILYANIGMSNFQMGNLEIARERFERAWQFGVRPYFMWIALFQVMLEQGDYTSAETWFEGLPQRGNPEFGRTEETLNRAWLAHMRDQTPATRVALDAALRDYTQIENHDRDQHLYILASLGNVDDVFGLYRQMIDDGWRIERAYPWLPAFAPVRKDPRIGKVFTAMKLVDYWREVQWPDKCGPGENEQVVCFR